jgi:hypothetical protein
LKYHEIDAQLEAFVIMYRSGYTNVQNTNQLPPKINSLECCGFQDFTTWSYCTDRSVGELAPAVVRVAGVVAGMVAATLCYMEAQFPALTAGQLLALTTIAHIYIMSVRTFSLN